MVVGGDWDAALARADLVIVETAENDVQYKRRLDDFQFRRLEDFRGLKTKPLPSEPIGFDPDFRLVPERAVLEQTEILPPYHICSAETHRKVLRYYNIPQVQMFEAFAPLHLKEAESWLHPEANGLPPPLYIDDKTALVYSSRRASFTLDLRHPTADASSDGGFTWYEEVPTKPGFIVSAVSASTLISLKVDARKTKRKFFSLSLGYLSSYGGSMGRFFASVTCAGNTLASAVADGEESIKISVYRALVLRGELNCPNATLLLNVTVVPSTPARGRNKVKLAVLRQGLGGWP
ncbi:hypothetical protein M885DRAFT_563042 [Pelagophyceae sp. CCMP2097]|nr:hypothetical protein M885DRAFT_563042 [Pelagophyceae sp. CCMP2097]